MIAQPVLAFMCALAVVVPIQRGAGTGCPTRSRVSSCSASGATCLFGDALSCSVTCISPREAHCSPAECLLEFPVAAVCECLP
jgi:hypothetical protein